MRTTRNRLDSTKLNIENPSQTDTQTTHQNYIKNSSKESIKYIQLLKYTKHHKDLNRNRIECRLNRNECVLTTHFLSFYNYIKVRYITEERHNIPSQIRIVKVKKNVGKNLLR